MSSPSGPETAAPLVEQGHLWLECDEGPDVGRSPEQVCEPEAVTVSAQEREEGSASTGAGRGLRGRGSGGQGAGPASGKGKGAGSAPPPEGNAPPIAYLSLLTDSGSVTLRTVR